MRRSIAAAVVGGLVFAGCGPGSVAPTSTSDTLAAVRDTPPTTTEAPSTSIPATTASTRAFPLEETPDTESTRWDVLGDESLLLLEELGSRVTLSIVGGDGLSHRVASWLRVAPQEHIVMDWSPDGRQVLLSKPSATTPSTMELWLLDLPSGSEALVASVPNTSGSMWGRFTRPEGRDVVVTVEGKAGGWMERRSPSGDLIAVLEDRLVGEATSLLLADGSGLVISDESGLRVVSDMGDPVRDLMNPLDTDGAEVGDGVCALLEWWNDDTVAVRCRLRTGEDGAPSEELWLVPTDGSNGTQLQIEPLTVCGSDQETASPPGSIDDTWLTDSGFLVLVTCPVELTDAAFVLGRFDPSKGVDGPVELVDVSVGAMESVRIIGVTRDRSTIVMVGGEGAERPVLRLAEVEQATNRLRSVGSVLSSPEPWRIREVVAGDSAVSLGPTAELVSTEAVLAWAANWYGVPVPSDVFETCGVSDVAVGGVFACDGGELVRSCESGCPFSSTLYYVIDETGRAAWTTSLRVPAPTGQLLAAYQQVPKGLSCRDLLSPDVQAQPFTTAASSRAAYLWSLVYWALEGHPDLMDPDGDGVPCEAEFDSSVIEAVLAGGEAG